MRFLEVGVLNSRRAPFQIFDRFVSHAQNYLSVLKIGEQSGAYL